MGNTENVRSFLGGYVDIAKELEDKLAGITGKLQFDFTEDGNGYWCIELIDGKVQPIREGRTENPTMTITGAFEVFYGLRTGKLKAEDVIPTGRLKLGGDTGFTMRLRAAGLV